MDRSWMYARKNKAKLLNPVFVAKLDDFIGFASSQPSYMNDTMIRCPCKSCKNCQFFGPDDVRMHLLKRGFISDYYQWTCHGEPFVSTRNSDTVPTTYYESGGTSNTHHLSALSEPHEYVMQNSEIYDDNPYRTMVMNAAGPDFDQFEEYPNSSAQNFRNMLEAAEQPLWPGCEKMSQLAMTTQLLNIKSEHRLSERCYDDICRAMKSGLPDGDTLPKNFYSTKKLVAGLGLPVEKIHCCPNGCMIFWGVDSELRKCKMCDAKRFEIKKKGIYGKGKEKAVKKMYYFPIAPRLQRLYASKVTAKHMRWHAEHQQEDGVMRHSSDSYAWKHFNYINPSFSGETRNVRLGLCTDGFTPFGISGKTYSSWPVIVTPYNLPPWMCMKDQYMFLTVIVPGPQNPTQRIDVYLQPFIAEMQMLWDVGVMTWDESKKQNFKMRVALMWTVSDFPAYAMLSGWSTHGKLACPYCMENSEAFQLKHGGKPCWFDCHRKFLPQEHPYRKNKKKFIWERTVDEYAPPIHNGEEILQRIDSLGLRQITELGAEKWNAKIVDNTGTGWKKRSIFWNLVYWKTNIIRHNIDVMHTEKNVFMNVFNTVMAIDGKTKYNAKAREDMKLLCRRKKLELNSRTQKYPKAVYCLDKEEKQAVCTWVNELRFPDGYVSNLGRCVDMKKHKLNASMKSHDCHVFMQRLVPIAFRAMIRLEPSGKCAGVITESFKHNFHKVMTWGALKIEQKDGYFDEFKKNCIWDENDEDIRVGWNILAATKYSSFMHNTKKHIGKRKPDFLLDGAWIYLLEQWDDPKVKTRSAIMKANRGRVSPHTGGSRSFANTADLLRNEQVVTPHFLFVHTHTSKNDGKTYISSKALSVEEAYQVEIEAQKKANEENGTPIDENRAYLIAAGGIKKSGLFGLGSEKIVQYGSSSSSSGRSQNGSSRTMQKKIDQLNDTILTERAEREAEKLIRDQEMQVVQQQISQMHAMLQGFTNATKRCAPQGSVDDDNHSLDLD